MYMSIALIKGAIFTSKNIYKKEKKYGLVLEMYFVTVVTILLGIYHPLYRIHNREKKAEITRKKEYGIKTVSGGKRKTKLGSCMYSCREYPGILVFHGSSKSARQLTTVL
ncbi:hypothetical protein GQX74_007992 [Glossina fuscipes]|nr:hypothetical protein GQX74_007992 [Glossina fuscipes]